MKKILVMYTFFTMIWLSVEAQVKVTPGTISSTMCQGSNQNYTISDIVLKEQNVNDIKKAVAPYIGFEYYIPAPTGYQFAANMGTITFLAGRDITAIDYTYSITPSMVSFVYELSTETAIDVITISGLQITPLIGAPSPVNITRGAGGVMTGNNAVDAQNHCTLTSIPYIHNTITYVPESYYCNKDNINYALSATPSGGTWTSSEGVLTGTNFNPFGLSAGLVVLNYITTNGGLCPSSTGVALNIKATPTVSIMSSDADNIICGGTNVTFTALASGTNQRYQFLKNGVPVTTMTSTNTYSTSILANNDAISVIADNGNQTCQRTSSSIINTIISNTVAINTSSFPPLLCSNNSTAYGMSGSVSGGTFSGNGVFGNNFIPAQANIGTDTIIYSGSFGGCSYSAKTGVTVVASPSVIFTSSDVDNIICKGDPVTFTANTGGTANRYLFLKNSNGIQGPNSNNTFLTSSLSNGDIISVTVDNGVNTCATTSTGITTTVGQIPSSSFSWKSTCGQNTITFHDLSAVTGSSILTKWDWDYNNDATIDYTQLTSLPDAVYTYPATNEYQARLRVTTDKGCFKDTVIRVYTLPGKTPTPSDPYAINFASSNQGWAYDGTNSSWGWGVAPSAFGMGTRTIWSTGQNSSDGNYKVAEHSYLYGPCIDFSQLDKPMIALKLSSKITDNPAGAILEATSDDGLNWIKLGNVGEGLNWYNIAGIVSTPFTYLANNTDNNPLAQGWADTISFNNAKIPKLGLQNYAGNTSVRFRINFAAVANVVAPRFAGIGIDSVWIGNRNKIVMIEHFTNTSSLCLEADSAVNLINSKRPKDVISMYEHTSWPKYDLYNVDDVDVGSRELYYGLTSVPETHFDGSYHYGSTYSGGTPQLRMDTIHIDARALVNSVFKIDITSLITTGKIDANVRVTYTDIANSFSPGIVIQLAITEDTVEGNVAANFVLWKMLPDAAGSYISNDWKLNPVQQIHETWNNSSVITSGRKFGIVVFIQNYGTKEVYQAAYIKGSGTFGSTVVTSDNGKNNDVQNLYIYPNPASTIVNIAFEKVLEEQVNWQMTDNLGKIVKEGTIKESTLNYQIDTNELANGLYYIKLVNENINQVKKLVINK